MNGSIPAPAVSVIIPFYAGVDWLCEAVQSVLAQTYKDFEILVINDGSKEDISSFIAQYGTKIRYFREANSGPGAARNLGIKESRGKYLAFLDADDLWLPDKLEKQIRYLDVSQDIWCMSTYTRFGDGIKEYHVDNSYFQINLYPVCFYFLPFGTPTSVVVRKDYLKKRNFWFAENMRYGEDCFLWLNIILSGKHDIRIFKESLIRVRFRSQGNAVSRVLCHIQIKADLWRWLNPMLAERKIKMPFFARFLYSFCHFGFLIVKKSNSPAVQEFLAKILYIFPFVCFKLRAYYYKCFLR